MQPTEEQQNAIAAPKGIVRIMAGPGSGKTFVLAERVAYFVNKYYTVPSAILVVSFTIKSTRELTERLAKKIPEQADLIQIKTLHSLCLSICLADSTKNFSLTSSDQFIKQALRYAIRRCARDPSFPQELLHADVALSLVMRIKQCEPQVAMDLPNRHDIQLCQAFDEYLSSRGLCTFSDLAPRALNLLQTNDQLRTIFQQRYQVIFVDEAQDLNPIQFAIITTLMGPNKQLTLAGDDDQAIYSWRGANPDALRLLPVIFPSTLTYELRQNFRCPPSVVEASAAFIQLNTQRYNKTLIAKKSQGLEITIQHFATSFTELQWIANRIKKLIATGVHPSTIAVLCRNNALCQKAIVSLSTHQIPVTEEDLLSSPQCQSLIALIHVLHQGLESAEFGKILNIGKKRLDKSLVRTVFESALPSDRLGCFLDDFQKENPDHPLAALVKPLFVTLQTATEKINNKSELTEVLEFLFDGFEVPKVPTDDPKIDKWVISRNQVLSIARSLHHSIMPLANLLSELETLKYGRVTQQKMTQVITLHRAKGLEFTHVFIPAIQPGVFPPKSALFDQGKLEEERRLLYVGMTRTQKQLYLSRHKSRATSVWKGFLNELTENLFDETVARVIHG